MIEWLTEKLASWCEKRGRVEYITGSGGRTDVYMVRYFVVKSRWFNFYIHRFLRSDRDDLHDHPWNFVTYLVRGAYTEKKWNPDLRKAEYTRRYNYRGTTVPLKYRGAKKNVLVFRRATDQHQVKIDYAHPLVDQHLAPLTVCLTGPKIRDWGFIKNVPIAPVERMMMRLEADLYAHEGKLPETRRVWVPYQEYFDKEKKA